MVLRLVEKTTCALILGALAGLISGCGRDVSIGNARLTAPADYRIASVADDEVLMMGKERDGAYRPSISVRIEPKESDARAIREDYEAEAKAGAKYGREFGPLEETQAGGKRAWIYTLSYMNQSIRTVRKTSTNDPPDVLFDEVRMLLPADGRSYVLRFSCPRSLMKSQRPRFDAFVASMRFNEGR